jgi:GH35 family endo-1,4-beta-xylanase
MHQGYWGVEKTQEILERYSRFNLPLHFTENTLVSGKIMPPEIVDLNDYVVDEWPSTPEGLERQAREVETHYRTLFADPNIVSITWWGFIDGGWLKGRQGFNRRQQDQACLRSASRPHPERMVDEAHGACYRRRGFSDRDRLPRRV